MKLIVYNQDIANISGGKVAAVIVYRSFRNPDAPGLVEVWNESFVGRGAVELPCGTPFEEHVLAKTIFIPAGLIVAEEEGRIVGFVHAAFGPNEDDSGLSVESGIISMVALRPSHRRRGVGSELLRQGLHYLRAAGAQRITAGHERGNPFYLGLYGGSACTGFLASDETVLPFLAFHGFKSDTVSEVLHRRLAGNLGFGDGRFAEHRRKYDFVAAARRGIRSWWEEILLGPLDLYDFYLDEKGTGASVARATVWEMGGFGQRWNESAAGLIEIMVEPEHRRKGLARFLLSQTFRYLQDQYFSVVETQVPRGDDVTLSLCRGVSFHAVDTSHVYRL